MLILKLIFNHSRLANIFGSLNAQFKIYNYVCLKASLLSNYSHLVSIPNFQGLHYIVILNTRPKEREVIISRTSRFLF